MREVTAQSWGHLHDLLYENSFDEGIGRYRSELAYRGLDDATFRLTTSLQRLAGDYAKLERYVLRNFRKYACRDAVTSESQWNWLALGQHHGLPTRLLDWTYSPLVAMHFATGERDCYATDGAIWCVDCVKAHALLPEPLRGLLHSEGAKKFTAEMLGCACQGLDDLDKLAPGSPFLLFFEPPSFDDRIVNQFALFSLLSDPTVDLDEWLKQHADMAHKVIIPARLKWEIRDKLDQANITERVLFPGLDGLSRWLQRYYSPKQ